MREWRDTDDILYNCSLANLHMIGVCMVLNASAWAAHLYDMPVLRDVILLGMFGFGAFFAILAHHLRPELPDDPDAGGDSP